MNISQILNPKDQVMTDVPPFDGKFRVTQVIGCPAAPMHYALGCHVGKVGFSAETLALFYEGFLHERDLKARVRAEGYGFFDIDSVTIPGIPIVGHPDGGGLTVNGNDEIIEFKSFGSDEDGIHEFMENHKQYKLQVQFYEWLTGRSYGRLIAKNRNTGWILDDEEIVFNWPLIEPYVENVFEVMRLVKQGIPNCHAKGLPDCSSDYRTRMFCPFFQNGHCIRQPVNANQVLEDYIADLASSTIVKDELISDIELLRKQIVGVMQSLGVNRVVNSEGVKADIYTSTRTNISIQDAQRVLPQNLYDQIAKTSNTPNSLRVTIPKRLRNR